MEPSDSISWQPKSTSTVVTARKPLITASMYERFVIPIESFFCTEWNTSRITPFYHGSNHTYSETYEPELQRYVSNYTLGVVLNSKYTTFSEAKSSTTWFQKEKNKGQVLVTLNCYLMVQNVFFFFFNTSYRNFCHTSLVILVTVDWSVVRMWIRSNNLNTSFKDRSSIQRRRRYITWEQFPSYKIVSIEIIKKNGETSAY